MLMLRYLVVLNCSWIAAAAVLPEGTLLEVRLGGDTGTRISRAGDAVTAVLIAPVVVDGTIVLPAGARVTGYVAKAKKLGWNPLRHTASIEYHFDRLVVDGWLELPMETRLVSVDTAREKVDASGRVHGMRPTVNVSSGLAAYAWRVLLLEPGTGMSIWLTKFAFARPPDPEIHFPKGTEMVLRVTTPMTLPSVAGGPAVEAISDQDSRVVSGALDSLPRRVRTRRGELSDVLNVIIFGSEENVRDSFRAAGWVEAEKKSVGSLMRTYRSIIERRAYPSAPMSTMTLEGYPAQIEYQKSLNSFARRHHIRLWRRPTPDGDLWVGAATEDISIGFSVKKMNWTHFIDQRIDGERSKVANDLAFTGCVEASSYLERGEFPNELDHGTGRIQTDGRVVVIKLKDCPSAASEPAKLRKPHAIKRFFASAHDELVRSNVLYVSYNATKLASAISHFWSDRLAVERRTSLKVAPPVAATEEHFDLSGLPEGLLESLPEGLPQSLTVGLPPDAAAAVAVPGSLEAEQIGEGPGGIGKGPH